MPNPRGKPRPAPARAPKPQPDRFTASSADVAARLKVSDRQVRKYAGLGMPHRRDARTGALRFDPDACVAWHAANVRGGTHGGKRGEGKASRHRGIEASRGEPEPQAAGREPDVEPQLSGKVRADLLHTLAKTRLLDLEYRKKRGELLDAQAVREVCGRAFTRAGEILREAPAAAAPDVVAELGAAPERAGDVERILRRFMDSVAEQLRDVSWGG